MRNDQKFLHGTETEKITQTARIQTTRYIDRQRSRKVKVCTLISIMHCGCK